jgi:hypothetical protein
MTAQTGPEPESAALSQQIRFLEKPFTPASLGRKVRELLDEDEHALAVH